MSISNINLIPVQSTAYQNINTKKSIAADHSQFIDVLNKTGEVGQVNGMDFADKEIEDIAKEFSGTMQAQLWASVFENAFPEGHDNIALHDFLVDALVKQQGSSEMDELAKGIYEELLRDAKNRNLLNEVVSKKD